MLETREDVDRLLSLLRSPNAELQQNALKNFMFISTCSSVAKFQEPGNVKLLIELAGSSNVRVGSAALRLLWHLSAQAEMKIVLYEEGAFGRIKEILSREDSDDNLACAAVLQNISEHRFLKGEINPNQVKLVNDGILGCLAQLVKTDDKRVQFLACLTVCNLSMNTENHKKILKSRLLDSVEQFVLDNQLHVDMVCHWLTLQPHIPLLHSPLRQVQLFSLSSLLVLSKSESETYKVEVWRCTSMNSGVDILFTLRRSSDSAISKLAEEVIDILQLEEPLVKCVPCDVGMYLATMFNNPEFSDVKFVCNGGVLYGHKAILAARCPQFRAMFSHFRESLQNEIRIPEETMDYTTLSIICEFIYTGAAHGVTRANAVDVLVASEMYGLGELKQFCERFLWYYVDKDNVMQLYRTASTHRAPQLARVCEEFIARNAERVTQSNEFLELAREEKDEIARLIKGKQRINIAKEVEEKGHVDSQGKHEVITVDGTAI
eukprot:Phypoly_transcript_07433.p1 GENE.Phypoly_transcript_07433~~Phypoly_transcript_07433.p1  ORF type:complete len:491 (+),score=72.21 Phypoly_transcript_07433:102-1574(+)